MNTCEKLEAFLRALDVIDWHTKIIQLDWPDHEEWMFRMYRDRVMNAEKLKKSSQVVEQTGD